MGDKLLVKLPSDVGYAPQNAREQEWLPYLAERLTLPIPVPVAQGKPNADYPFHWAINRYLEGEVASVEKPRDMEQFARDLGEFLRELQAVEVPEDGPEAGAESCYRGAALQIYADETHRFLTPLADEIPSEKLRQIFDEALKTPWDKPTVWVHGDIAPSNLLVKSDRLVAVIDWGIMSVGDPACDLAIAWMTFDEETRPIFLKATGCDAATIKRGRAWALWGAVIRYHHLEKWRADESRHVIAQILTEI